MILRKLFIGLGMAFFVSACSDIKVPDLNPFSKDVPPPSCPSVRVLGDAKTITKFREGEGRDLIDILFEGKLLDISGACAYEIDNETLEGILTMEVAPVIAASRGPADRTRTAGFEYFVALFDDKRTLLSKETFAVRVSFAGNVTRLAVKDEPVLLEVPLKEALKGGAYEVIVGFTLNKEELHYNRRRGRSAL